MANSPWSVKGVDPETREAAKTAARQTGVTLGVWLRQVIRQAAAEQLTIDQPSTPRPQVPDGIPAGIPVSAASVPGGQTLHVMFETMQKLARRIEQIEGSQPDRAGSMAKTIDGLTADIGSLRNSAGEKSAQFERAIARLSERLQRVESVLQQPASEARPRRFGLGRG